MDTSALEKTPRAQGVAVTGDELIVYLKDGRTFSARLSRFPRLQKATPKQRSHFELLGDGEGIHWPNADEDFSVAALVETSELVSRDFRVSMSLPTTIVLALLLAMLSCLTILLQPVLSAVLVGGWALASCYAFLKYGLQGWPVLLGAPFCFPVIWLSWIMATCAQHGGCP